MTVEEKIVACVNIYVGEKTTKPSKRKAKEMEIRAKIADGTWKESDLDKFLLAWSWKYK
jgi:hypothetical protein